MSRNLLEVTIAKDASPTPSSSGDPLLDINVATPNGASNHLLIKMAAPHCDPPPPVPKADRPKKDKLNVPAGYLG